VNYFTSSLSTDSWACSLVQFFGKIVSNSAKDSCINLIIVCSCVLFVQTFGVSILFLVARAYVSFGLPSVFWGEAGLSFSCLSVFVK
jgi:hypothetical protein